VQGYVPGVGPKSKLAIIGIAPGSEEVIKEKPFVGPSGSILRSDLKDAGINIEETYRTNIFKYQLPNNQFEKYQEIGLNLQEALADLQEEINTINPNCILGLGDPVLKSLTGHSGINSWRGSILFALGKKAVFTWHPAAELHGEGEGQWKTWQRYVRKFDVQRAVEESSYPELDLSHRNLIIARSYSDVFRFFERNKNESYCALDIEAIENIPVCIGFSFIPSEALCIPLFNTLPIKVDNKKKSYERNVEISTIPSGDLALIWQEIAKLLLNPKVSFIGQNFKYDEDKLNRLGFFLHSLHWDIMIGTHCISSEMPKSLAYQTSIYTREPYYKDEGKELNFKKEGIEQFFLYNCKDACITREIFDVQQKELKEIPFGIPHATWRMQLHKAYLDLDRVGFAVDEEERWELIHKYVEWGVRLEKELFDLIGHTVNFRSPKQVAELLYEELKIPKRAGTGEQVITGLLGNVLKPGKHNTEIRICEIILEYRRVDKSLGYLKAAPDYDGRMKTTFRICGTENYRTSTNILDPPIRPEKMGWAMQTVSKHGDIGNDLRSILVADRGFIIVNIDQSQAEARVCSLLADDEKTLKEYDLIDKHALTASKFFGGEEKDYSKKILGYECPERFVGKAQPLTAKILTPSGWKLMKDIRIGDTICNSYGSSSKVTGVYPQEKKDIYEVEFSDGSKTQCCLEHNWNVRSPAGAWRDGPYEMRSLSYIKNNLRNNSGELTKLIPITRAVEFEKNPLPIHPYVVGLLLGDGTFRQKYSYGFSSADIELVWEFENLTGIKLSKRNGYDYAIPAEYTKKIKELGVHGQYSEDKHIPENYKFSCIEDRLAILRGLMDTDGTVNKRGTGVTFDSASKQLAKDVIFLVNSLGGIATYSNRQTKFTYNNETRLGMKSHRVFISNMQYNPFNLDRKLSRWKQTTAYRRFKNIKLISNEECQCISVNSGDRQYITDDFIVTHNTLRHAYHLDIGKREAMVNVNTDARKYKIRIRISEWKAGECLKILAQDTPKIKSVFHETIQNLLRKDRRIVGTYGASRYFYDDDGTRDLYKGAYSFIPQQTVSDKTKQVLLKIKKNLWDIRVVVETHDALTLLIRDNESLKDKILEIQSYFLEPISFADCSIPRRDLVIPCDVEVGYNYKELGKWKG